MLAKVFTLKLRKDSRCYHKNCIPLLINNFPTNFLIQQYRHWSSTFSLSIITRDINEQFREANLIKL